MRHCSFSFLLILAFAAQIFAAEPLYIGLQAIDTDATPSFRLDADCDFSPGVFIVQFDGPILADYRAEVQAVGCLWTGRYHPANGMALWVADKKQLNDLLRLPFIRWTGRPDRTRRVTDNLNFIIERNAAGSDQSFLVVPAAACMGPRLANLITEMGGSLVRRTDGDPVDYNSGAPFPIRLPITRLRDLAALPETGFIEPCPTKKVLFSHSASGLLQAFGGTDEKIYDGFVNADDFPLHSRGLHGQGQVIGISDTGIDYMHLGFADPVSPRIQRCEYSMKVPYASLRDGSTSPCDNNQGHGTSVAACAAQDITPDGLQIFRQIFDDWGVYGDAIAHEAQLVIGTIEGYSEFQPQVQVDQLLDLIDAGASAVNISWAWETESTVQYTSQSWYLDETLRRAETATLTIASGNDGICDKGAQWRDIHLAKSGIDVGMADDLHRRENIASRLYSSERGPNHDGSIHPDVVAPGDDSTQNRPGIVCNAAYGDSDRHAQLVRTFAGTSAAAPHIAGSIALIHQYFEEGNNPDTQDPSGALMKAVLIASAKRINGECSDNGLRPGPAQGWGFPVLRNALVFEGDGNRLLVSDIRNDAGFTETCDVNRHYFYLFNDASELRIALVWTDEPGAIGNAGPALVNDLDLVVASPSGSIYVGNNFHREGKSLGYSEKGDTRDNLNSVECVFVRAEDLTQQDLGKWTVRVEASNIPNGGPQGYALVMLGVISDQPDDAPERVTPEPITTPTAAPDWKLVDCRHVPDRKEPGYVKMRSPLSPAEDIEDLKYTIGIEPANLTPESVTLMIRGENEKGWKEAPVTQNAVSGLARYFILEHPCPFTGGDMFHYYFRIQAEGYDDAYLYGNDSVCGKTGSEDSAQAMAFRVKRPSANTPTPHTPTSTPDAPPATATPSTAPPTETPLPMAPKIEIRANKSEYRIGDEMIVSVKPAIEPDSGAFDAYIAVMTGESFAFFPDFLSRPYPFYLDFPDGFFPDWIPFFSSRLDFAGPVSGEWYAALTPHDSLDIICLASCPFDIGFGVGD